MRGVAELIRDVGQRRVDQRCDLCDRWSLFAIAVGYDVFSVCLMCDTTAESRRTANLKSAK